MIKHDEIFIGIYEKALPYELKWEERLNLAKKQVLILWKFLFMNPIND